MPSCRAPGEQCLCPGMVWLPGWGGWSDAAHCAHRQYHWYDERGRKVKCTAPQYVDFVMSSVQKLLTDEDVFPTKYGMWAPSGCGGLGRRPRGMTSLPTWLHHTTPTGREFPSSFESLVKRICRYLFHVLAHIYSAHFKETLALELHAHLNTLYVHFILFAREFHLLDPKETAVMDDLTEVLCGGASGTHNHVKER